MRLMVAVLVLLIAVSGSLLLLTNSRSVSSVSKSFLTTTSTDIPVATTSAAVSPLQLQATPSTIVVDDTDANTCVTTDSLHNVAVRVAQRGSPRGSASYNQTFTVLQAARSFLVSIRHPIFTSVKENMKQLLQGYGLVNQLQVHKHNEDDTKKDTKKAVLLVLQSIEFKDHYVTIRHNATMMANLFANPIIVLESEQLVAQGNQHWDALKACHVAPLCAVWGFSDSHQRMAYERGIGDSFMILPIMHQNRFGREVYRSTPLIPLANRSIDVAMFGYLSNRRMSLIFHCREFHWNVRMEKSFDRRRIVATYLDTRVCLIPHSLHANSATEFHRLTELVESGCVPVMEDGPDEWELETYSRCGGVVFSNFDMLTVPTTQQILQEIQAGVRAGNNSDAVEWWRRGVQWSRLLQDLFPPLPPTRP